MRYDSPRYLFRRYEVMRRVRRGESFLEIGPGNLRLAQELLSKFPKGTLIDFNPTDVQRAYDKLGNADKRRLTLIIEDFSQYDRFPQAFDCVVACEVLEHVQDDAAFLRKANQLLADRGQLILSVPARMGYWATDDELAGHYRRYERRELHEKLIAAGYSGIKIVSYGFPFQNLVRLVRIATARIQYREKAAWDQRKRTQQSAFMIQRRPYLDALGLVLNKYTMCPFSLFASLFNAMDLGEGYVATALRAEQ